MATVNHSQTENKAMHEYTVYLRSDCGEDDPQRFTVISPNACALPLKPLNESQAKSIADFLNSFLDEWEG